MPTPRPNESEADFVSRCMGDAESVADFPEPDQRAAFCYSVYERFEEEADNALQQMVAHADGAIRTATLMGREMRVIPAVMVQQQVLNNNLGATFLPADEIAASVDSWNGMPVVLRHPTRNGQPISARTEDTLNARGLGMVLNAKAEDGRLKADLYLDVERMSAIPDAKAMLDRFAAGQVGELSTGFGTRLERTEGVHNGARYNAIMRDIRPDHLALLPDERGACSVADGCGLGANREVIVEQEAVEATNEETVMGWLARIWAHLTARHPNEDKAMTREDMLAALASKTDCELRALLSEPEAAEAAAPEEAVEEPQVEEEAVVETDEVAELRAKVAELEAANAEHQAEREAAKAALVDELSANARCTFSADELKAKPMCELEKIQNMLQPESYVGRPAPRAHNRSEALTHMPVRPYWASNAEVN